MKIYESAEDYLEAILVLRERIGLVRSIDVVNELGYSKPSVSVAMKKLRENGYVVGGRGRPHPPDRGRRGHRQPRLQQTPSADPGFLSGWASRRKWRQPTPCKIEHDLSEETFEKIKAHAQQHGGMFETEQSKT